ncbi:YczE/YyaS/YitT family protein [Lactobacillus ultunensis]|uniref:Uncharacterized protein n=1 Tax=Lactobacillus ultunensis DSM 16047 TaxID=525365 RepID=C2ENS3_9LACO|nr:hypothetical protein [Lactobacillus ultunensis]EEJ71825.1 hypothetical protein HMPREF0548_1319 [Lactobacillus ultunensis DSM 16047]KRL80305.1 membrane protein [Lactobacillus ultunensis DSM 16047]QQP28595.1 hypothetical protein H4B44_00275 [Lactobacillus ultunensis]
MANKNDPMKRRVAGLIAGLVINAVGNGLTVSTNMGTSPWTASEVNLAYLFHLPVGIPIFTIGALAAIVNQILIKQFDKVRFFGELLFVGFFSYFVDIFLDFFNKLGVPNLPIWLKIILCFIGIFTFCCAISFYQRANIFMHPSDDTTNILRFRYFKGNVIKAQLVNFSVALIIIIVCVALTHKIYSVNIGTIICLFANGPLIAFADRHLWHSLHHNFRVIKPITDRDN